MNLTHHIDFFGKCISLDSHFYTTLRIFVNWRVWMERNCSLLVNWELYTLYNVTAWLKRKLKEI